MLLVAMGTPEEGERFFAPRWPEARAVSDEDRQLYAAFGLTRGRLGQVMGPRVWAAGLKALLAGHGLGKPVGDPIQMSGWFLVRGAQVAWSDVHEHSGAERRWQEAIDAWRALEAAP